MSRSPSWSNWDLSIIISSWLLGVKNADENELRSIATDPDEIHMYNVNDFSFLLDIVDDLTVNLCNSVKGPGTVTHLTSVCFECKTVYESKQSCPGSVLQTRIKNQELPKLPKFGSTELLELLPSIFDLHSCFPRRFFVFFTNNLAEKTVRKNCRLHSDPPWGIAVIYRTMKLVCLFVCLF